MKNLLLFCLLIAILSSSSIEKDYTDFVKNLKDKIGKAPFKGSAYNRLAYISDTYGPRMWGSMSLEQCIYEIASMASKEGFENVRL